MNYFNQYTKYLNGDYFTFGTFYIFTDTFFIWNIPHIQWNIRDENNYDFREIFWWKIVFHLKNSIIQNDKHNH